jgi:hypothetical protein
VRACVSGGKLSVKTILEVNLSFEAIIDLFAFHNIRSNTTKL